MQAQVSLTYILSHWELWCSPLVGLLSAGLTLMVGRVLMDRRRSMVMPSSWEPPSGSDPFIHGSASEKRQAARRKGRPIKVFVADPETHADVMEGWVVDRSLGGLRITVNKPLTLGAVLSVRATNAPTTSPWVDVEVRNHRRADGQVEVGCQFVRTPPWGVLLLFG